MQILGTSGNLVGAVAQGGYIFRLSDRHDIRVGIASGMYLKGRVPDRALRIELLAVLHLCYWRWSTKAFLLAVAPRLAEYTRVQPLARADILTEAWRTMWRLMEPMHVVSQKGTFTLTLQKAQKLKPSQKKSLACYHPAKHPSSCRTGPQEFAVLIDSVADGSLWRAGHDLDSMFETQSCYELGLDILTNVPLFADQPRSER